MAEIGTGSSAGELNGGDVVKNNFWAFWRGKDALDGSDVMASSSSIDRERDIFSEAMDLDPGAQREDFVAKSCGDDASLKARVEAMLQLTEEGTQDELFNLEKPMKEALESRTDQPLPLDGEPVAFGDYEIMRVIGRGSMGSVYEARQLRLKRLVALKMVRGSILNSASDVLRFQQEAEATANLHHPNIVPIYEVGEEDGHAFFSMKLLTGGCFSERTDELQKSPRFAVESLVKVAKALQVAHQNGIIHRDIKPSNIVFDDADEPHITDFGLAKHTGSEHGYTLSGQIIGTPSFMAPEQADSGERVSTLADVYGLGGVLYQILTGKAPARGNSIMAVLNQLRIGRIAPPSKLNPDVDPDLETIAMKCLERDPQSRYGSARQLADELTRWLNGEPILARPLSRTQKLARWSRKNRTLASLSALTLISVLTLAIGGPLAAWHQRQLQLETAAARSGERRSLYAAEMISAGQLSNSAGGNAQVREFLDHWIPEPGEEDLRGWEWRYLDLRSTAPIFTTPKKFNALPNHTLRPDSDEVLIHFEKTGETELWNWKTGELVRTLPNARIGDWRWSGADQLLGLSSNGTEFRLDVEAGEFEWLERKAEINPHGGVVAVDPRGKSAAFLNQYELMPLHVLDLETRELSKAESKFYSETMKWSDDGRRLAIVALGRGLGIHLWDSETGELRNEMEGSGFSSIDWLPNNEAFAATHHDQKIFILRASDLSPIRSFDVPQTYLDLAWSPNGELLAGGGADHTIQIWTAEGVEVASFSGHDSMILQLSWSEDSRFLVSSGYAGRTIVWDVAKELRQTRQLVSGASSAAWSPDGTRIALDADLVLSVWNLDADIIAPFQDAAHRSFYTLWNPALNQLVTDGDTMGPLKFFDMSADIPKRIDPGYETKMPDERQRYSMSWRSDGRYLAVGDNYGVTIFDHKTGEVLQLPNAHAHWVMDLGWSDADGTLASCSLDGFVRIWDPKSGEKLAEFFNDGVSIRWLEWEPGSGDRIAIGDGEFAIRILDVSTGEFIAELKGQSHTIAAMEWSPNGKRLVATGPDGMIRIWDMETYAMVGMLQRGEESAGFLRWSPDGKTLLSVGSKKAVLWKTD